MNISKIRFWSTEQQCMLRTKVSCVSAFRHYLHVAQMSDFSDTDTTPHPEQYIPMIFTGMTDRNEKEVWESDLVSFDFSDFLGNSPGGLIQCVVVYDETLAMFGLKPLEISDNSATVPLMGLNDKIEVVGNVYEGMG